MVKTGRSSKNLLLPQGTVFLELYSQWISPNFKKIEIWRRKTTMSLDTRISSNTVWLVLSISCRYITIRMFILLIIAMIFLAIFWRFLELVPSQSRNRGTRKDSLTMKTEHSLVPWWVMQWTWKQPLPSCSNLWTQNKPSNLKCWYRLNWFEYLTM